MVFLQAPPYTTFVVDFSPNEKIRNLVQRVKDQYALEFRGDWTVQDTSQNKYLTGDEIVMDQRIYRLNAFIASAQPHRH